MRRLICTAGMIALGCVAVLANHSLATPQDEINLTGTWTCDDEGTYYVRQIGKTVWWIGMSPDDGKTWTNTFKGVIKKGEIVGDWADVPRGENMGSGSMTLSFRVQDGKVVELRRERLVGDGFGGARWTRKE